MAYREIRLLQIKEDTATRALLAKFEARGPITLPKRRLHTVGPMRLGPAMVHSEMEMSVIKAELRRSTWSRPSSYGGASCARSRLPHGSARWQPQAASGIFGPSGVHRPEEGR